MRKKPEPLLIWAQRIRTAKCETPDAGAYAVEIERDFPCDEWADHICRIPEEFREAATKYLRDRYRIIVSARRRYGARA